MTDSVPGVGICAFCLHHAKRNPFEQRLNPGLCHVQVLSVSVQVKDPLDSCVMLIEGWIVSLN